jgi:RNA polymerase sigma-70 factor (sigma-E family)
MLGSPTHGREAEFAAFVDSASRYLTRTAFLLCGDEETASDLVQEALVRTYAVWWRVRPADARAYARRVLVNLNIDRYRRPSAMPVATIEERAVEHAEGRVDDRDELRRMLASLAPQQRRVIVLRYFDDLSEAEVAQCLGISVGSVKASCSRGLAALRGAFALAMEGESR